MDKRLILLLFLLLPLICVYGQDPDVLSNDISEWLESLAVDGAEVDDNDEIQDLLRLVQSPIDLNTASRESLSPLFFLSDLQIENLMFFLYTNGPMLTVYELQAVEGFSEETIKHVLPFVTVLPVGVKQPVAGESVLRAQMPLETPLGYLPGGAYLGSKHKLFARARVEAGNMRTGISVEKDAGEPMFGSHLSTFDHVGAFIEVVPRKIMSKLVLGDYRFAFGQGLALSTGMTMGKGVMPANIRTRGRAVHGYASSDEVRFLRGVAAEVPVGRLVKVMPFASYKGIDAVFSDDSLELVSLPLTGYHRTDNEMDRRRNVSEYLSGLAVSASFKRFALDGGYYLYGLSKPVREGDQMYGIHDFSGRGSRYGWVSYTSFFKKMMFTGEFATMDLRQTAISQSLTWEPDGKFALSARWQRFSLGYFAPYMAAGSRNANPSGESNVYVGFQVRHSRKIESRAYGFFYQNKWLRYSTDAPSEGLEGMWRLQFSTNKVFSYYCQFKWRYYSANSAIDGSPAFALDDVKQQNARWQAQFVPSEWWRLITRAEYSNYLKGDGPTSDGAMVSQDLAFKSASGKWAVNLRYGIFNTDDYNSRIYSYEPDVRYAFSVPSWSGQGTRTVVVGRWSPNRNWDLYARWANVKYANRTSVGSGHDEIAGASRNEFKVQVVYSFHQKKATPRRVADTLEDL